MLVARVVEAVAAKVAAVGVATVGAAAAAAVVVIGVPVIRRFPASCRCFGTRCNRSASAAARTTAIINYFGPR
jgi:hypothetical protein